MPTTAELFETAVQHHQAGRLETAEQIYRQILAVEPDRADAVHLLGVLAHQSGKHEMAVNCMPAGYRDERRRKRPFITTLASRTAARRN